MTLARKTAVVGLLTGASRILGFVREVLMAVHFGTSLTKSAFDVAFRIPNLFRRLFGEGALFASFIPVLTETMEKDGHEAANRLVSRTMTLLIAALGLITVAGMTAAWAWLRLGDPGERTAAVLPLLEVMFPYSLLICVAALFMAVLNSAGHFTVPAAAPMVLNAGWIASVYLLCPLFGERLESRIFGVAWGVLLAGVAQVLMQVPTLARHGFRPRLDFALAADGRVRQVLLLMGPAALGMGIVQVNVFVDGVLAMIVGKWAPAALTYAERLVYLPLGVFATAIGTVLLPTFSRQVAQGRIDDMRLTLNAALRRMVLVMLPASVGLCMLAVPVVRLAYVWKGGAFDEQSVIYSARALACYAPGLLVFSLNKAFVPAFYAMKDTRTPVRAGLVCVALNFAMNLFAVFFWPEGTQHAGIAFATVISSAVNSLLLAMILHKAVGDPGWRRIRRTVFGACAACCAMAAASALVLDRGAAAAVELGLGLKAGHLLSTGSAIAAGSVVYLGVVWALCREDCGEVLRLLLRARGRS